MHRLLEQDIKLNLLHFKQLLHQVYQFTYKHLRLDQQLQIK